MPADEPEYRRALRLSSAFAATAAWIAAIVYLGLDVADPEPGADAPVARAFAHELVAITTVTVAWLWVPRRWSSAVGRAYTDLSTRSPWALATVVALGTLALVVATTRQIEFGSGALGVGYGHDGVMYGAMAERFFDDGLRVEPPFSFRVLPSLLVHLSGLDAFTGFLLLNVACFAGCAVLVGRVARALGASAPAAVLCVALFVLVKFGVKMWIFYPLSVEAAGLLLGLWLVDATLRRNHVSYVLAMCAAVFVRENLLAVGLFHLSYFVRTRRSRVDPLLSIALHVAPAALYWWSRQEPYLIAHSHLWDPQLLLETWTERFLFVPGRQQMVLYGWINALGALVLVAMATPRATIRFLATEWEFVVLFAVTAAIGPMGGADYDRFAVWMVPPLVAVVVRCGAWGRLGGAGVVAMLALQLAGMEIWQRWAVSEHFYLTRYAAHPVEHGFHYLTVSVWAFVLCFAATWLAYARPIER